MRTPNGRSPKAMRTPNERSPKAPAEQPRARAGLQRLSCPGRHKQTFLPVNSPSCLTWSDLPAALDPRRPKCILDTLSELRLELDPEFWWFLLLELPSGAVAVGVPCSRAVLELSYHPWLCTVSLAGPKAAGPEILRFQSEPSRFDSQDTL